MRFNRSEICAFAASHAKELAKLADEAKLETLVFLFRMAEAEAQNITANVEGPGASAGCCNRA